MDKVEAREILQKHIAKDTTKKHGGFCAMPENTDIILEAMIECAEQENKKTAILFMEWYGSGKTDLRILPDAYDEWKSKPEKPGIHAVINLYLTLELVKAAINKDEKLHSEILELIGQ